MKLFFFIGIVSIIGCSESKVKNLTACTESEIVNEKSQRISIHDINDFKVNLPDDSIISLLVSKFNDRDSVYALLSLYDNSNFDSLWYTREFSIYPNLFASDNIGIIISCFLVYAQDYPPSLFKGSVLVIQNHDKKYLFDYISKAQHYQRIHSQEIDALYETFNKWILNWKKYGIEKMRDFNNSPLTNHFKIIHSRVFPTSHKEVIIVK